MKRWIGMLLGISMLLTLAACDTGTNPEGESKYKNTYRDVERVPVNKEGLTWPAGQVLPTFAPMAEKLDAIDIKNKSSSHRSMLTGLAGIVNRKQPRIMMYTEQGEKEKWHEIAELEFEVTKDMDDLVRKYKDEIKGLVIWDTKVKDTINLATVHAGLEDALIVNEKLYERYTTGEFSFPVIADYRGKFQDKLEVYQYLYDNLWEKCSRRLITGISPDGWELRDLAVAANTVMVWLSPEDTLEKIMLDKFLAECNPGETYFIGWWTSEGDGVTEGSKYGIPTIPGDYYYNYSVYSATSRQLDPPTVPAKPKLENKYYISFTLSDGDNLQYMQHAMKEAEQLWPHKDRGTYPINWTSSPAMLDAGPQLLNHYFKTATEKDLLICGPSGLGYTYATDWTPSTAGTEIMDIYTRNTDTYFRQTGFNIITVWNQLYDYQQNDFATKIRSLIGFSVQERIAGQPGHNLAGNRIPLLTTSPRYDGQRDRVLEILTRDIRSWDGSAPVFQMPQLESWAAGVPHINYIAKQLEKEFGDKVEFVRGDHMMMLYNEHYGAPYNIALQSKGISASGQDEGREAAKAVDGSFAQDKGWVSSQGEEKWLMLDLEQEYKISRYVVKNAACGYYAENLNTKGFQILASKDGEKWTVIDAETNNQSNIVDKDVDAFQARYVKLLITDAGADGVARIQEFELYGNKV